MPRRREGLRGKLALVSQNKIVEARVIEILGDRVSVQLTRNGNKIYGIRLVGGPVERSDIVHVDYTSGTPVAHAIGDTYEPPQEEEAGSQEVITDGDQHHSHTADEIEGLDDFFSDSASFYLRDDLDGEATNYQTLKGTIATPRDSMLGPTPIGGPGEVLIGNWAASYSAITNIPSGTSFSVHLHLKVDSCSGTGTVPAPTTIRFYLLQINDDTTETQLAYETVGNFGGAVHGAFGEAEVTIEGTTSGSGGTFASDDRLVLRIVGEPVTYPVVVPYGEVTMEVIYEGDTLSRVELPEIPVGGSGYLELDDIQDVEATSPSDEDVISYNSSTLAWEKTDLDDRYYRESEVDSELSGKSDTGHTHLEADVTDLDHDADKIKGADVPAPTAGDDGKALVYDHLSGDFDYGEAGGSGSGTGLGDLVTNGDSENPDLVYMNGDVIWTSSGL